MCFLTTTELNNMTKRIAVAKTVTIGDLSAGNTNFLPVGETTIGNIGPFVGEINDIVFVVYTERVQVGEVGQERDVIRLISARLATNFERGLYYGKC